MRNGRRARLTPRHRRYPASAILSIADNRQRASGHQIEDLADRSMRKLGLDTLDLYLLHWPMPNEFEATVGAWKAAKKLLADGRVRALGVNAPRSRLR